MTAIFLTACQTVDKRITSAAISTGEARASNVLPAKPKDCRRIERSGVVLGDRLDVALIKTDQALGRANARIVRCAAWDDAIMN